MWPDGKRWSSDGVGTPLFLVSVSNFAAGLAPSLGKRRLFNVQPPWPKITQKLAKAFLACLLLLFLACEVLRYFDTTGVLGTREGKNTGRHASAIFERWVEVWNIHDAWKDCDIVGSSARLGWPRSHSKLHNDKVWRPPARQIPSDSPERIHKHPLDSVTPSYRFMPLYKTDAHEIFRTEGGG